VTKKHFDEVTSDKACRWEKRKWKGVLRFIRCKGVPKKE